MLATKEPAKEKEVKAEKEVKETKPAAEVKETKPKKEDFKVRHLTDEETKTLMEDKEPVEGYINKAPQPEEVEEEKKPVEKKAEKAEEKPAEKPAEEKKDFFERVETELVKPEGKEDLKDFTPREKAYFYQMRRDRKLRQQAEEERDQVLFREAKQKADKKEEKPEEDEIDKFFKERDPEDYLTVKEVKELIAKTKGKPDEKKTQADDEALRVMQMNYLKLSEQEAKKDRPDFDAVMELAPDMIGKNQEAINEISARTQKGENPAVVMYEIIKKNKDFETLYPAAEIRAKARKEATEKKDISGDTSSVPAPTPEEKAKEEKAKQVEKTLEENTNRTKTTAHVSSLEGKPAEELTIDEITKMSDLEFAKLPKAVRQRYLKKYGA